MILFLNIKKVENLNFEFSLYFLVWVKIDNYCRVRRGRLHDDDMLAMLADYQTRFTMDIGK